MEAQLRRLGPTKEIKFLKVPKESTTRIWLAGRGTMCEIYTKSQYASRQHFSITYRNQEYYISDLKSTNGTFINDEKLVCEKLLTFGDIISLGVTSEMQDSPDCIVYVFESSSNPLSHCLPKNNENCTALEVKNSSEGPATLNLQNNTSIYDKPKQVKEELCSESLDVEMDSDVEKIDPDESSSSDIILIEPPTKSGKLSPNSIDEPKPAKIRKLDDCFVSHKSSENEEEPNDIVPEDEEVLAYEAQTQVDEELVKSEPDLLNYSQTEELIEITDSEDDWSSGLKLVGNKPEVLHDDGDNGDDHDGDVNDDDDDDDVMILETVIREHGRNELPPVCCKVEDDMTETDKKWIGRLLKIEKEELYKEFEKFLEETESGNLNEGSRTTDLVPDEPEIADAQAETHIRTHEFNIVPCTESLDKLSTSDVPGEPPEPAAEAPPTVELPKKITKRVRRKKSVSFDMIPQIKYFEVPAKPKLTASDRGRMRFTRIIFNICNWNTHWLEECKSVAPDKIPSDLCEEKLRKIPKKFPNHAEYMIAFIPAMLLQLWNQVKDKWVASGETGFRQTISCDSCEDYHAENLSVYKCTGLVQNVNAHKQLIREGHLVLLRIHQIAVPTFTTLTTEKYSKKLGYLVFGFVESKIYERYQKQPMHKDLAERCASIVGDLHIVRLNILVKKRPSFLIDKEKLLQLTVVHQISQELKMFRGICLLPDSPLCKALLQPTKHKVPAVNTPKDDLVFKGPLAEAQSEIVRKLSHLCSCTSSFLYNIHGASGTGKGQIICALILQLLCGTEWESQRPKIIYCTQWSIPLDEMVVRLKVLRQSLNKQFKLVRVGPVREVKPDVRDLSLFNLASSVRNSDKRVSGLRNFDAEIQVIKEADVLFSTCTSAGMTKMCAAFEKVLTKNRQQKIICIIDEAMSCKETESVIPLLLGVTHLILVGDIFQMEPPFSGQKTHSLGLDRPLFWRIYKNFENTPKELWPITILKTQYRMNSCLSNFTSQLIYRTVLQTPSEDVSSSVANIRSHLVLLDETPEDMTKEEKDNREVRIVSRLTKAVLELTKAAVTNPGRFGIIACDTKQIESLQSLLPKRDFPEVEIDQIQGFQGRELDVVIFVCPSRRINNSWVTTALTRARRSLFIFGSEQSINESPLLRKMANNAVNHNFLKHVNSSTTLNEFEQIVVR